MEYKKPCINEVNTVSKNAALIQIPLIKLQKTCGENVINTRPESFLNV